MDSGTDAAPKDAGVDAGEDGGTGDAGGEVFDCQFDVDEPLEPIDVGDPLPAGCGETTYRLIVDRSIGCSAANWEDRFSFAWTADPNPIVVVYRYAALETDLDAREWQPTTGSPQVVDVDGNGRFFELRFDFISEATLEVWQASCCFSEM